MITASSVPFDIRGPLPTGVTVLEASAGTGKTYTIAALAARYVAEGMPLDRLLLVTFTRMATGELRERVRERLVGVERGLSRVLAGDDLNIPDEVVRLLAEGPNSLVHARHGRLARAVADFDAATIATTHGFCQEVLGGLGIAGDVDRDATFVEDISDIVEEVVDDLYVRRFYLGDTPPFDRTEAASIAWTVIPNPAVPIVPTVGAVPEMRRRLALAVRKEVEHRKRRMAIMTFDDLLTRLDDTLAGVDGEAAAARLRARYGAVLVDEFQDTDRVQWSIVRRAFGEGDTALVLIGDPKQAIYAFRGADVYAYLEAAETAGSQATLQINWRSDQSLLDAYDALFAGAGLGHEGIVYRQVRAAEANIAPRLSGAPCDTPLRIRVVSRDAPTVTQTRHGYANAASVRAHVAQDLAADVVALLASDAEIETRSEDGASLGRERVQPGHVAVLVPTNRNAALIREALDDAGVPAVINGAGSVFGTPQAREWLRLLEAIDRPASRARAHSAALTCFLGWNPEQVASAGDDEWEEVHRKLHHWARLLRAKGVASLTETVTLVERLPERVLTIVEGERRMTDLRHVGQLLHAAATMEHMGTTALTAWLRQRIAEAEQDTDDEERSRRLESDAEAIQVLTIHRSKGLEFPIVYLPFLWEPGYIPRGAQPTFFHDPNAGDARTIDVSLEGPDFERHQELSVAEQRGEDLRLAYVALTRARHQAIVWWAGTWASRNSPLTRLLFDRDADGNVAASGHSTPRDEPAFERFEALAAEAAGCIVVERSQLGLPSMWGGPAVEQPDLAAASFERHLDWRWRRTSYSDITDEATDPAVASEPEEDQVTDEHSSIVPLPEPEATASDPAMATPSLFADVPVGRSLGTLVHSVLEATDFAATDLDAELTARITDAQGRGSVEVGDPVTFSTGLRAAIETPLGPMLDGLRLCDVQRRDRLDELRFEFPLAGGDMPTGEVQLDAIGAVLREHLPPGDPLAGYAGRLEDPTLRHTLRGYLTGSVDAVLRVSGPDGTTRFAVVDYKTNWLGGPGEALAAWHYRPSVLAVEMQRGHYALQALLYTAALHRYLRWRLASYDAERNLAGVLYLFLRGMSGAQTPTVEGLPCGVFAWRPRKALVEELSDVFDRGSPT